MVNSGNFACAEFSEIRLTRDLGSPLGPFSNSRSFSHTLMPSSDRLDAQILGFGRWGRHRSRVGQEHLRHVGSASALDQEGPDALVELSVVDVEGDLLFAGILPQVFDEPRNVLGGQMPHGRPDAAGVLLALVEAEAPLLDVEAHLGDGARVPHSELRNQLVVPLMSLGAWHLSSSLWALGRPVGSTWSAPFGRKA